MPHTVQKVVSTSDQVITALPNRKMKAVGIGGMAATLIMYFVQKYLLPADFPEDMLVIMGALVAAALAWISGYIAAPSPTEGTKIVTTVEPGPSPNHE